MEPKKCAKCSGELVALNGVNKLFLNRYIISDAHLRVILDTIIKVRFKSRENKF